MNEVKYKIIENPSSKNKQFCHTMQASREEYENTKYSVNCLPPMSMLLKSETKESLIDQIEKEQSEFEKRCFFRVAPNLWVRDDQIFSFLNDIFQSNSIWIFSWSILELNLQSFYTFPSKTFTASPFWFISKEDCLNKLKNDFFILLINTWNKSKDAFFTELIKSLEGWNFLDFFWKLSLSQDWLENDKVNFYKDKLLLSKNAHNQPNSSTPYFCAKWKEANKILNEHAIKISFNQNKKSFLVEEWHHRVKAIYDLLSSKKLDMWIFDKLCIDFGKTSVVWNWIIQDL